MIIPLAMRAFAFLAMAINVSPGFFRHGPSRAVSVAFESATR